MDRATGILTVFFEEPFWVGIFEHTEAGMLSVSKVTFGAEPKDYEIYDFILKEYDHLKFSPAVAGEQLDLYLVSQNIGTLWFGIGKTSEASYEGLDFVIMIAISKIDDEKKFRKDMYKSKRKSVDEIWLGETVDGVSDIIRFAPSACNTQPWIVEHKDAALNVYRYKKPGKRGIMPVDKVSYFNQIDMGIFLCFLDLCLQHESIPYEVQLFTDQGSEKEKTLNAVYKLSTEENRESFAR